MLNQNAFVQDPVYLCMTIEREELTHPLLGLAIPGDICQNNDLFTLLLHLPHSLFYKRTWHPDPNKMVALRH